MITFSHLNAANEQPVVRWKKNSGWLYFMHAGPEDEFLDELTEVYELNDDFCYRPRDR